LEKRKDELYLKKGAYKMRINSCWTRTRGNIGKEHGLIRDRRSWTSGSGPRCRETRRTKIYGVKIAEGGREGKRRRGSFTRVGRRILRG